METASGKSIIVSSGNILAKSIAWKNSKDNEGSHAANEEVRFHSFQYISIIEG
jgi:hypothetical protein